MTVAVNETVLPTATDVEAGDTVTVVTTGAEGGGAVTVMLDVPLLPDDVAVTDAEPGATPVTMPVGLTVTIEVLFADQEMDWLVMTLPA